MSDYFNLNEQKFSFGCMRLPLKDEEIDISHFRKMVDVFLAKGLYFHRHQKGIMRLE